MRVVVVEDEPRLRRLVVDYLNDCGYAARGCADGEAGLAAARADGVDAVVLDRMLPGLSGVEVCRRLRREGSDVPVLMLTARGAEQERIGGLDAGADDYVVKPFSLGELAARLRALHRRRPVRDADGAQQHLACGDVTVDLSARRAWRADVELDLSARELDLLAALLSRAGSVVSRTTLLDDVWGSDQRSNTLEVHVKTLRAKLDRPFGTDSIRTVRGHGYRFERP